MQKIHFISLGCDKNLVDSEQMIGLLSAHGFEITYDETKADAIIINTCAFIGDAKEESINTIISAADNKINGNCKALIICGCLAERYFEQISEELPEVDGVIGTTAFDKVLEVVNKTLEGEKSFVKDHIDRLVYLKGHRALSSGGHYAYLKIAEGCNKHCSYCAIPLFKGAYRSVPMEDLIEDAKMLADSGVKELIIVAQETTLYGMDLYGEKTLHKLLAKLCEIKGIMMIRLLYAYPEEITDELIDVMAKEDKICKYIDMPIQHASDEILKRMGRRTKKADLIDIIKRLRDKMPDISIRTTLISGFPGESEKNHEELLDFVREIKFDRLGVFPYSPEEGTKAAMMSDQVDAELAKDWSDEIMALQQDIAFEAAKNNIGKTFLCIVEGVDPENNVYVGRTYKDAPEVDGLIFIETEENLMTGDMAYVKVTGAYEYDLIGELA